MTDAGGRSRRAAEGLLPLPREFYARPTATVARELLGKILVRTRGGREVHARIVEVEAYLGERDQASHARRGPTQRAAIMFGPPGFLYVYLVYGMHHCMNLVTEADGVAGAVLVRAAERLPRPPSTAPGAGPLSGPGKLCAALGITRAESGLDVTGPGALFVASTDDPPPRQAASPRIGVAHAGAWAARRLRFYIPRNVHVSGRIR